MPDYFHAISNYMIQYDKILEFNVDCKTKCGQLNLAYKKETKISKQQ